MERLIHACGLLLLASAPAWAAYVPQSTAMPGSVPSGVNYQGRLEERGNPVTGTKSMVFRVYDAAAGGNLMWTSAPQTVSVTLGLFNASVPLPVSVLVGGGPRYLEVEIAGVTMTPRELLNAVPYALIAKSVEGTIDVSTAGLTIGTGGASSLFISSETGNVGIGTVVPAAPLDVSGAAQFGSGAAKSTFSAAGLLSLTGSGNATYSLRASSGVIVQAGGVVAPFFVGDGSALTGIAVVIPNTFTSTTTFRGAVLLSDSSATLTGAQGYVLSQSSISTTGGLFGATLSLSSSIVVSGGGVSAPWFAGDGSRLTNLPPQAQTAPNTFNSTTTFNGAVLLSGSSATLTGAQGYVLGQSSISTTGGLFGNSLQVSGSGVVGGAAAAAGAGATDLTATGAVFFGTGGSYKVTSAGDATLGVTNTGNLQLPTPANSDAFVTLTSWTGSAQTGRIVFSTATASRNNGLCSISGNGTLNCRGSLNGNSQPDLAEHVQAESDVTAADVVAISERPAPEAGYWGERTLVRRSARPYEVGLVGVIAGSDSGLSIGAGFFDESGRPRPGVRPLALAGRVPVKVTLEGGPIRAGDALTSSSTPGHAMRASEPGPGVGVALEAFDGSKGERGSVMVFVDVGERGARVYNERLQALDGEVRRQDRELDALRRELDALRRKLESR